MADYKRDIENRRQPRGSRAIGIIVAVALGLILLAFLVPRGEVPPTSTSPSTNTITTPATK